MQSRKARVAPELAAERIVLVAEDNDLNFELLSAILGRDGLQIRWARDGSEAVAAAAANHHDLMILDLHLPELSGLDVLRRVRADPSTREMPILVLTADAMEGTRQEALREGATEIVTKPFDVNAIRAVVARLLP
jgi:CheY-like chemotaxis protein